MTQLGRSHDDSGPDGPTRAPWWRSPAVVAPAVALVVGLVLGGLVVGAGGTDGLSRPGPTVTVTAEPDPEPSPGDTSMTVPQECLEAAETVEEAVEVMQDGVAAVRDFRRNEIVDLLNRLEDLDTRARDQAATCSEIQVSSPESAP